MAKKALIAVVLVALMTMAIAGCTTSTTNSTTNSPAPISAQSSSSAVSTHNPILERYVTAQKAYMSKNGTIQAWEVTWLNDTAVKIQATGRINQTTGSVNRTVMVFPSTGDATTYLDSLDKTGYAIGSTKWQPGSGPAETALGHVPSVFTEYANTTYNDSFSITASDTISQADNLVYITQISY